MTLSGHTRIVASREQVSAPVDDGVAVLDLRTNTYYALDHVGAVVWAAMVVPATLDALVAAVTETFEVDAATAGQDVRALVTELIEAGLARIDP